jgi:parvulin-like peptidyl-prolyl isomerase
MIKQTITIALTSLVLMTAVQAESKYGTVNGQEITQLDIDMTMGPSGMKFEALDPTMKKRVLDMVVERKLLAAEAEKSDVVKSDDYKEQLEELKKGLVLDIWMKEKMKKIEDGISKTKIEEFYKKNSSRYPIPKQLKARHILVKGEDNATAILKELEKAKDKKATFIKLAEEKSTGPSGPNGGDLGWFELGRMVPEFSAAADKLKKGEYTKKAVKTQFGLHIIYLDDRREAGTKKLEEVEDSIREELSSKEFGELIKTETEKLKKSAKIELK